MHYTLSDKCSYHNYIQQQLKYTLSSPLRSNRKTNGCRRPFFLGIAFPGRTVLTLAEIIMQFS